MKLSYLGRVFLCQSWQLLEPAALLNASVKQPTWPSSHWLHTSVFTSAFSCSPAAARLQVQPSEQIPGTNGICQVFTVGHRCLEKAPRQEEPWLRQLDSPTHWGRPPSPACSAPHPGASRSGGDFTLLPQSCPHSPAPTKLSTQRDRLSGHRSNSSCTQQSPGDLVPSV